MAYGSVFDTITTSTFKTTKVVSPPKEIVNKLNDLIDPIFLKLKRNSLENQTITKLRDTLLPKLISGEVRVKDIASRITEVL
jgi:type I restriction enzyme S subunit